MKQPRSAVVPCLAAVSLVAATAVLWGCSTGESAGEDDGLEQPNATVDCVGIGAIEGGGRQRIAGVLSGVGADGALDINGMHIVTTDAEVVVDGSTSTTATLNRGDIVTVAGSFDLEEQRGCASRVVADAGMTATIDSIDLESRSLVVLGQSVRVLNETVLGDGIELSSLRTGDRIRVSGTPEVGSLIASRIDLAPGEGYFVTGTIRALDAVQRTFVLNDLVVQYDVAALANFVNDEPRDGDAVRVTGTIRSGSSPAALRPDRVERVDYGIALEIFPTSASVRSGGTIQFLVTRSDGPVNWRLRRNDGSACSEATCGTIDAGGRYTAPADLATTIVLVTASSAADPRVEVSAPVFVHGPYDFPVTGSLTLSGEVLANGAGVEDASVNIWVGRGDGGGFSYTWAKGPVESDAAGRFLAPSLLASHVAVFASKTGYEQPCAATARVHSDTYVRVELVPASSFDALEAPRPQLAVEPWVTGEIYEMTATGRIPVTGAVVWLEDPLGVVFARTRGDGDGSYFVCNVDDLPNLAWLTVVRDGFETVSVGPVNGPDSRTIDIELKRSP
jgi:hypothetical protein